MSVNSQKCPICSESIETMYSLHSHCIEKHPRRFVCCPICFQPLKNSQSNRDLVKHSNFLHRRKTKKEVVWESCVECAFNRNSLPFHCFGFQYNSVDYAPNASYRFGEHMLQDKSCVICSKDFSNHKQVTKHIREIHLAIKYLCNQCPKTFSKLTHLKNHHSTKHGHGSNTKSAVSDQEQKNYNVRTSSHCIFNFFFAGTCWTQNDQKYECQSDLQAASRTETTHSDPCWNKDFPMSSDTVKPLWIELYYTWNRMQINREYLDLPGAIFVLSAHNNFYYCLGLC